MRSGFGNSSDCRSYSCCMVSNMLRSFSSTYHSLWRSLLLLMRSSSTRQGRPARSQQRKSWKNAVLSWIMTSCWLQRSPQEKHTHWGHLEPWPGSRLAQPRLGMGCCTYRARALWSEPPKSELSLPYLLLLLVSLLSAILQTTAVCSRQQMIYMQWNPSHAQPYSRATPSAVSICPWMAKYMLTTLRIFSQ